MDKYSTEVVYTPPLDKYSTEVVHPPALNKYSTQVVYPPPHVEKYSTKVVYTPPQDKYSTEVVYRGGGGECDCRDWQKMRKNAEKCGKCGQKCDRKCGFVRMVFAPRNPYGSSRLAQLGAQSMDGSMEQLSAVVQLKNITD